MGEAPDLVVKGRRVALPGGLREAALEIRGGRISAVHPFDRAPAARAVVDAGSSAVLPGFVDTHVHVNDPGRAEWEGFETATSAAAAGGVTTIVDMPLNSRPVTTTREALAAKLAAARGRLRVDCGFWGGLVPGSLAELEPLLDAGVRGFKAFLIDSGIEDFPAVGEADLRAALPVLKKRGAPLLVHAELAGPAGPGAGPRTYASFLASRPKAWENEAVRLVCRLSAEFGARVHVVHLSSAEALTALEEARSKGAPVTAETCPHYLALDAASVPDGATEFKCCPPIRDKDNQERLWKALRGGLLDFVVSDHSPCVPELKAREEGDFLKAWGGIASLQLAPAVVWTEARRRGAGLSDLVEWMSRRPAAFAGLEGRKGRLAPGADADFILFNDEEEFTVDPRGLRHRHKLTPYAGRRLAGVVAASYLRGAEVHRRGGVSGAPQGVPLLP